jgi:hypothetical protein
VSDLQHDSLTSNLKLLVKSGLLNVVDFRSLTDCHMHSPPRSVRLGSETLHRLDRMATSLHYFHETLGAEMRLQIDCQITCRAQGFTCVDQNCNVNPYCAVYMDDVVEESTYSVEDLRMIDRCLISDPSSRASFLIPHLFPSYADLGMHMTVVYSGG